MQHHLSCNTFTSVNPSSGTARQIFVAEEKPCIMQGC
uniref:Uncharacterized protein n=1 Tax=Arundo donax TaxID=35708 RepID=A0A0A9DIL4_ARUDO